MTKRCVRGSTRYVVDGIGCDRFAKNRKRDSVRWKMMV